MLKKRSASLEELMPLVRSELQNGESVRIYPGGTSMLPMLREGVDSVVLTKVPEKLKKYDVILYQRKNGQYVLHRLVKIDESYTFLGDNQFDREYGIEYEQIIARVSSFYRGSRRVDVNNVLYKAYCFIWHVSRGIRRFWRRGVSWIKRILK